MWPYYIPELTFVTPLCPGDGEPLIGFHLSVLMGYVESALFFCLITKTVANISNSSWGSWKFVGTHPLDMEALKMMSDTGNAAPGVLSEEYNKTLMHPFQPLPPATAVVLLQYVDVYTEKIIGIYQGYLDTRLKVTQHPLYRIACLFHHNDATDTTQKEPNSIKNQKRRCLLEHQKEIYQVYPGPRLFFWLEMPTDQQDTILWNLEGFLHQR